MKGLLSSAAIILALTFSFALVDGGKVQAYVPLSLPKMESFPAQTTADVQFPYESISYAFTEQDKECLALNVYWEARNQDVKGKVAVALVTMARVKSKYYPNNVCDVVWQKAKDKRTGKIVPQFSWTLDGKSDTPKNPDAWLRARLVTNFIASNPALDDFTDGALLYHADYVDPYWKDHYELIAQIGTHYFYK